MVTEFSIAPPPPAIDFRATADKRSILMHVSFASRPLLETVIFYDNNAW